MRQHVITALGIAASAFALTAMAANEPANPQTAPAQPTSAANKPAQAKSEKMVDLNNASKAELMTLPSVGDAEAAKIIANRPYVSKVDLVTKAGLPEGLYVAVRHKVVVNDMKKPASKQAVPKM